MRAKTVEKLAWILIYGGLGTLVVGTFVRDLNPPLGWLMVSIGALVAVAGGLLIFVRSRMADDPSPTERPPTP